ncbi:MAG: DNA polymerase III subunit delta [Lachnospiraceae bacterium]|nr:DNA polymerase III subunit delta [Lachnospiraceae bacterium]
MKSLNEDIKTGSFKQVYLLFGEEEYLKNQYKNRLHRAILSEDDTMNFSSFEGKGVDVRQIIDQAETLPFFADHRMILIEQSGFFKNASPELAEYIPQIPAETILVFVEKDVDKRGKLYKAVQKKGRAVELGRQDEKTLQAWVLGMLKKEKRTITRDALTLFLEKSGNDMENIANELEKLLTYTHGKDAVEYADVEEICTVTTESRVFDMIRAVAEKKQKQALDLYYDLLSLKEPPMRILFLIARQFNQMMQVKDLRERGYGASEIASKAGIAPFIVKKSLAQSAQFEMDELYRAVKDCVEAEEAVKTGRLGDCLAVEMVIVKYSQ